MEQSLGESGGAADAEVVTDPPTPHSVAVNQEDEKADVLPATPLPSATPATAADLGHGLMSNNLTPLNMPSEPPPPLGSCAVSVDIASTQPLAGRSGAGRAGCWMCTWLQLLRRDEVRVGLHLN